MSDSRVRELRTPRQDQDPRTGQFVEGNKAAVKHGLTPRGGLTKLDGELAERRAAVVADLGGEDALSTIAESTIHRYVVADALLSWMEGNLLAEGVITPKGKRRAMHNAYLAQLDRVVKLANMLGLDRKARSAPTLHEVMRGD